MFVVSYSVGTLCCSIVCYANSPSLCRVRSSAQSAGECLRLAAHLPTPANYYVIIIINYYYCYCYY